MGAVRARGEPGVAGGVSVLPHGIRRLFRLPRDSRTVAADVDLEIEHHFAAAVEDLVRRGVSPGEAERIVEQRFGSVALTRDALIAMAQRNASASERREWWAGWALDLRHALRSLGRTPGVTTAIIVMLALGIGANAAIYGILEKLLLRPPPHVTEPDRIRWLYRTGKADHTGREYTSGSFSYAQYEVLSANVPALEAITGAVVRHYYVGRGQQSDLIPVTAVTGTFFPLLGISPFLGRLIEPADDREAATPAAVISYGLWRRSFGASESALGTALSVNDVTYTIVGVAPRGFSGPDWSSSDIWVPVRFAGPGADGPDWRRAAWLKLLARVGMGVLPTVAAEQATSALRSHGLDDRAGRALGGERVIAGPIVEARGPLASGLNVVLHLPLVVAGVATIVLLIACANVTVLLLLRATGRRRELAIRTAIGGGRWRVARLLVVESV
ncbi:MAG: ABC transporter permease, partial [Gemmatimonadetes bacterium]|nr:ABC transporter permease [Gemmatimonadota bacterium]